MTMVYGAKTTDLEQAHRWFEAATGLTGDARDSDSLGGAYYRYVAGPSDEWVLFKNEDQFDGEPIFAEAPAIWKVAVIQWGLATAGPVAVALDRVPQHFQRVGHRPSSSIG